MAVVKSAACVPAAGSPATAGKESGRQKAKKPWLGREHLSSDGLHLIESSSAEEEEEEEELDGAHQEDASSSKIVSVRDGKLFVVSTVVLHSKMMRKDRAHTHAL